MNHPTAADVDPASEKRVCVEVPDEEFETIGGLIYDRVGGVPRAGQSFDEHGLRITIEKMDGQRIRRVRVMRLPESTSVSGEQSV